MRVGKLAKENLSRILGRLVTNDELKKFHRLVNLAQSVPDGDSAMLTSFGAETSKVFAASCHSHNDIAAIAEEALLEGWQQLNPLPTEYVQHLLAGISATSSKSKAHVQSKPKKKKRLQTLQPAHKQVYEDIFKKLLNRGMSHSQLSAELDIPPATLTRRLEELTGAGKVKSDRKLGGYYRPDCLPKIDL